ncbi:hypothetical protein DYU05_04830 [Mucilaginibacter terrenus]|uniref:Uncharacterized protein n=1 Tax=Mucilaginibacter terrenus TaxID=2482727 RepID=A0A3E2NV88_9SPHI|nr:hypothetical protein [Mucilaginibacter terrenus]RFZ84933.1 hypothetical protein DYU05_04830 [Mucilaginibacter terrenus]
MYEYTTHLEKWLTFQRSSLELVAQLPPPKFESLQFHTKDINVENYNSWIEILREKGINNQMPVLYYFNIESTFDCSKIHSQINEMKRKCEGSSLIMLPKINSTQSESSSVLYVGKTNSNFLHRFKTHIGITPNKIYALQLAQWATNFDLKLNLYFAPYTLPKEQHNLLEQVEHVLHFNLKPILGRAGH